MKNFWYVQCKNCGQQLRLTVRDEDLGRKVNAICAKCNEQTPTIIGVREKESHGQIDPELRSEISSKLDEIAHTIMSNEEVVQLLGNLTDRGIALEFALSAYVLDDQSNPQTNQIVEERVNKKGEIAPETFSPEDKTLLKEFRIRL